jgi:hypothetical protein
VKEKAGSGKRAGWLAAGRLGRLPTTRRFAIHRSAVLLLCAFVAVVASVMAAPAPFPRPPRASRVWFDGWARPLDPLGGCRFERKGDKLTITVPGKGNERDCWEGLVNPPRLLRDVQGDFVAQVRVAGHFTVNKRGPRRAGILLADGKQEVRVMWTRLRGGAAVPTDRRTPRASVPATGTLDVPRLQGDLGQTNMAATSKAG